MKRLVIYTCVTGGYDKVSDPVALCPEVDYICFSSSPLESSVWQWRPLPSVLENDALTSRWPKINPHEVLPEYEFSLWIDANVIITGQAFYDKLFELMDKGARYAGIHHPFRDDVYEEAERVIANSRETLPRMKRAVSRLIAEGYPRHTGLMENCVILRKHNDPQVVQFDCLWWSFLEQYTYRDQISQGFCLRKTGLQVDYLLPQGVTARNSKDLAYVPHSSAIKTDRSLQGRWNVYRADVRRFLFRLWLRSKI